jgi:hypothetical protein
LPKNDLLKVNVGSVSISFRFCNAYDGSEIIGFAGGKEVGAIAMKYFGEEGNSEEDQGLEVQHGGVYQTTYCSGAGNGTNKPGFTGLPGGERNMNGYFHNYVDGYW